MPSLRIDTTDPNRPEIRCDAVALVCAVEAEPNGPRVALGPQASARDNVAIALAAIAYEAGRRYGFNPGELLLLARDVGLPNVDRVSSGGIILPAGVGT